MSPLVEKRGESVQTIRIAQTNISTLYCSSVDMRWEIIQIIQYRFFCITTGMGSRSLDIVEKMLQYF